MRHAIAQAAESQSSFEIGDALVAVRRDNLLFDADRAARLLRPVGSYLPTPMYGTLSAAIHHRWNTTTSGVGDEFDLFAFSLQIRCHLSAPMCSTDESHRLRLAPSSFSARFTTGGSIIFEPRLTTPRPFACASSNAATILQRLSISLAWVRTPRG